MYRRGWGSGIKGEDGNCTSFVSQEPRRNYESHRGWGYSIGRGGRFGGASFKCEV